MKQLWLVLFVLGVISVAACTVPVAEDTVVEPEVTAPEEIVEDVVEPELPPEIPEDVPEPEVPAEVVVAEPDVVSEPVQVEKGFTYPFLGSEGAFPVIEYGDFSNQVNSQVASFQVAAMKRDYIVSNKIKLVFKPFPDGSEESQLSAEASLCMWEQGSKQFWAYHDTLFTYWLRLDENSLNNYVGRIPNADEDVFATCLSSGKYKEQVAASVADGKAVGVSETPTFIIGSEQIVGSVSVPYKTFKQAIDGQLSSNTITGNVVLDTTMNKVLDWFS